MDSRDAVGGPLLPRLVPEILASASVPAFAPIVSDTFDQIGGLPEAKWIGCGSTLIQQDDNVDSVFLLRSGLVKLTYGFPDGRETTLGLRSSGSYIGAAWVLTGTHSMFTVAAVTPCSLSAISASEFALKLIQNPRLMRHFMMTMCQESMSQSATQAQLMVTSAEGRLRHFMRERKSTHLRMKTLDTLPLLKQVELAQLLAIAPEHLSRLMRKISTNHDSSHPLKSKMTA